jgi:hypothetical protein
VQVREHVQTEKRIQMQEAVSVNLRVEHPGDWPRSPVQRLGRRAAISPKPLSRVKVKYGAEEMSKATLL